MSQQTLKDVQDYYGKVLKTNDDLKTSTCCPLDAPPPRVQALLKNVHDTVQSKFYGCGSPLPVAAEGRTVLDLGCGTGRDAFLLSQIVGEKGQVIGIDMTDEQLSVANQYIGWHMDKFGHKKPNVKFVKGYIEDLQTAGIKDNSVDIVISNCVINLSPDKEKVFSEIYRVLKPGGELYFSDVFAGRRIPKALQTDKILLGECLGGAMYTEDFRRMMAKIGIADTRIMSKRQLTLDDAEVQKKAGMIDFYSMTMRAFKVDLEDICENYGHVAYYKGTIPECPHSYVLDDHHEFKTGIPVPICGNTANMLLQTRFTEHFRVEGDFFTHYGVFDCAPASASSTDTGACC
ncbi:MAG: methyltransferase type 11 [Alphaproteobacteria bacterium CG_4_9_14_3_um_filter_47_13]|nr:MAG: methyltransferase type 11 [Alphaproteobacteria bacterium CG_4_9_14_3_um_filter_47_13]